MNKLPHKIGICFTLITAVLILIHTVLLVLSENSLLSPESLAVLLFDLNKEKNLPALFSSFGLFSSGVILLFIFYYERKLNRYAWLALGIIFFFLAYDELFAVHETLIKPVRDYFNATGYFYFAWVIPYGAAVLFLMIIFYRFLKSLPAETRSFIILSAFIYISGAWGLELFGGNQYVNDGEVQTSAFRMLYTIEESLEMSAVALFIYTISKYLVSARRYAAVQSKEILTARISNVYRRTGTL